MFVAVGPLGVAATGVVAVAATELVGVLGATVAGTVVVPAWGVMAALVVTACGATGVPPFATVVWAAAVCFANSSIIAIGFSPVGNGETNNPG